MRQRSSGNMAFSGRLSSMPTYTASPGDRRAMISLRDCTPCSYIPRKTFAAGIALKGTTSIWRIDQGGFYSSPKWSVTCRWSRVYSRGVSSRVGAALNGVHHSRGMKKELHLFRQSWRSGRCSRRVWTWLMKRACPEYLLAPLLDFSVRRYRLRDNSMIIVCTCLCYNPPMDYLLLSTITFMRQSLAGARWLRT